MTGPCSVFLPTTITLHLLLQIHSAPSSIQWSGGWSLQKASPPCSLLHAGLGQWEALAGARRAGCIPVPSGWGPLGSCAPLCWSTGSCQLAVLRHVPALGPITAPLPSHLEGSCGSLTSPAVGLCTISCRFPLALSPSFINCPFIRLSLVSAFEGAEFLLGSWLTQGLCRHYSTFISCFRPCGPAVFSLHCLRMSWVVLFMVVLP